MTYRKPYLKVEGPGGEDMIKTWGSKLIGVKIIDRRDGESDEAAFMFTRKGPPTCRSPARARPTRCIWAGTRAPRRSPASTPFQRVHIFGQPKQGQKLHLICRGADFIDTLKGVDSGHFDAKNGHKTLGDVFNSLFKGGNAQVRVHPDIAKRAIAGGYLLRWNQSKIDFAQEVAEENGGVVKPLDGKILILKRGSGESASGQTLPVIQMPFDENYGFDYELEPRFSYQKVSATYLDTDKGTLEREEKCGGAGKAKLLVVGLNPQRIGTESEARVPGTPTWTDMDYQATGLVEAVTFPYVIGGLDAVEWLQRHHEAEEAVNYYRLRGQFLGRMQGLVRICHLFIDETHLHPFDGVGRRVGIEMDLVYVGGRR